MAIVYFWGSVNYMIYAILAVGFYICYSRSRDKSTLWLILILAAYIAVGMLENFSVLTNSYTLSYFSTAFAATLAMQLVQTYLYYRAIASLGHIELQKWDTYFITALSFLVVIVAGIPQTRGVYHFLLYTVMLWGIIRLYPKTKEDAHTRAVFFAVAVIFALQLANILSFILNRNHTPLETRTLLERQNGILYFIETVFEMLCMVAEFRYRIVEIIRRQTQVSPPPEPAPAAENGAGAANGTGSAVSEEEKLKDLGLTDREIEILDMLMNGLGNREIAEKLYIAEGTVKTHIHHIYQKLGITSRGQLIKLVRQSQQNDTGSLLPQ